MFSFFLFRRIEVHERSCNLDFLFFLAETAAARPSKVYVSNPHVHILTCTQKQLGPLAADNAAADRKRGGEQEVEAMHHRSVSTRRPLSGESSLCRSPHRSCSSHHKTPPPSSLFLFSVSGSVAADISADISSPQSRAMRLHFFFPSRASTCVAKRRSGVERRCKTACDTVHTLSCHIGFRFNGLKRMKVWKKIGGRVSGNKLCTSPGVESII